MAALASYTLPKEERLCSRSEINRLFEGANRSLSAFPLRMVYTMVPRGEGESVARMMVSVPKRYFKRAVHRNRVKRQVREAYRHAKHDVLEMMGRYPDQTLLMAFVWVDAHLQDSSVVAEKVGNLIGRLCERC